MSNQVEIKLWVNLGSLQGDIATLGKRVLAEAAVSVWVTNPENPLGINLLRQRVPADKLERVQAFIDGLLVMEKFTVRPVRGGPVIGLVLKGEFQTAAHRFIVKRLEEILEVENADS